MSVARLKAVTGEVVEIHFSINPYVSYMDRWVVSIPGSGGSWSTKATDIRLSLDVPPNRPRPDRVLVKLHAEPQYGGNGELEFALEPTGERSYSGQLDRAIIIRSGSHGNVYSYEQEIEFVLVRSGHEQALVDPINQTTRFQIDLYQASTSDVG